MFDEEKCWKKFRKYNEYLYNLSLYIERNDPTRSELIEKLDETYRMLRENAIFFYDGKGMKEDWYSLTYDLEQIEDNLPVFYIMPSRPDFYYEEKRLQTPPSKNAEDILNWIVFEARSRLLEKRHMLAPTFNIELTNYCGAMSDIVEEICKEIGVEETKIKICPGFDDDAALYGGGRYHYASIITLNNTLYLVDCSYRQFFSLFENSLQRIGIPGLTNSKVGSYIMLTEMRKQMASELLKKGWIPLDEVRGKCYFDGFALSYRNGIYYEETGDYSFTTPYTLADYLRFLKKEDSQLNHEKEEVLKILRRPCILSKPGLF